MELYQPGHSTPIAPATFQHYMRENASFEVMFTEGVEITIHVIVTTAPPIYSLSSPGKESAPLDVTEKYIFHADKGMKVSELRFRAWRLMKGKFPERAEDVGFERVCIAGENVVLGWGESEDIGVKLQGQGRAPELAIWVRCG